MRVGHGRRDPPLLLFGIFVVLCCVIVATAMLLYARQRDEARELRYRELQSVAELLASKIRLWRESWVSTARAAAAVCACSMDSSGADAEGDDASRSAAWLRTVVLANGSLGAHFLDTKGAVLLHAHAGPCPLARRGDDARSDGGSLKRLGLEAMRSREPQWSRMRLRAPGQYCVAVAVPAVNDKGSVVGSVMLCVDTSAGLHAVADNWQVPMMSMEALLISPEDAVMVRLRHGTVPTPAVRRRMEPCDLTDVMVVQALNGRVGHLRAPVAGRAEMYGHILPLADTGWILLVREDSGESNAPARAAGALWIVIVLTCIAGSFAALLAIWRNQSARLYREMYEAEVEQSRVKEEAFQARAILELILNTIPQRVFWKDRDGRYLGCNRPFAQDAGLEDPDDVRGLDDYALSWKENAEAYRRDDRTVMETGEPKLGYVEPQTRTDGSFSWLRTSKVPLYDEKGNVQGVLGTYEDITQAVQAEDELEETNRELRRVLSAVSHDLRTPLVSLTGYVAEMDINLNELRRLLQEPALPPDIASQVSEIVDGKMAHDLGIIASNANRMNRLISGVLALARIGRMQLNIRTIGMKELVEGLVQSYRRRAEEQHAMIEVGNLPNCEGDADQIARVFDNLLSNALKYLDPARPGHIRVSGNVHHGNAVYCVEDNGIGIAPADQDRVFDLFWRRAGAATEGEGLGLATVKSIVTRHGGKVWVESEPGEGSRFFVRLPRRGRYQPRQGGQTDERERSDHSHR